MELDNLVSIVQEIDEEITRGYTILEKKLGLQSSNAKYWLCTAVGVIGLSALVQSASKLLSTTELYPLHAITLPDTIYNGRGILGNVRDEVSSGSESSISDGITYFLRAYNRIVRTPTFLGGVGFVGAYVIDLLSSAVQGTAMKTESILYLQAGLGLILVSSSMYLKDTDPQLLDKEPGLKRLYGWLKEKAESAISQQLPRPILVPIPVDNQH